MTKVINQRRWDTTVVPAPGAEPLPVFPAMEKSDGEKPAKPSVTVITDEQYNAHRVVLDGLEKAGHIVMEPA